MVPLGSEKILQVTFHFFNQDESQTKDKDGQEKKSLKEKIQQMQEITLMVQNGLGLLAHVIESIGNVFNFSVPYLSWLAFIALTAVTLILYYIPLRLSLVSWLRLAFYCLVLLRAF